MRLLFILMLLVLPDLANAQSEKMKEPVRLGVVGLVHGHVGWILGRENNGDVEVVGIAESNTKVVDRYAERFGFSRDLVFNSIVKMLDEARPEAVAVFTDIRDHRRVVELCAPRGIHVMVEKPLAISHTDAVAMASLADEYQIHLITNFETTWYPSVHETKALLDEGVVGPVRKVVVRDGHKGPKEIGVPDEFFEWLTDPDRNGAGALMDFGCYGANLITWLMDGARPLAVTAVAQQIKPDIYKEVDDEATIIVTYPEMQGIVQASWNWPFSRKDMTVYGRTGYIDAFHRSKLRLKTESDAEETAHDLAPLDNGQGEPFSYLASVVRGERDPSGTPYSLEINLVAMEILDAAIRSAKSGNTVLLDP